MIVVIYVFYIINVRIMDHLINKSTNMNIYI